MNILLPHSWLQEYCKTAKKPHDLAKQLALTSLAVERVIKDGSDYVYDIEVTGNRPDTFGVIGVAREVKAVLKLGGQDLWQEAELSKSLKKMKQLATKNKSKVKFKVDITDKLGARRWSGAVMTNVKVSPSPEWLQKRLKQCGLQSINNIVDITNYVMLATGQPMHAFDADLLSGPANSKHIIVRSAKEGEDFTTLDNNKLKLKSSVTVIADDDRALVAAGIKGGQHAGISEKTKTIIFEAGSFDPVRVRRSSRDLDVRTDSSIRFEKSLDPEYTLYALNMAMELAIKVCGATPASEVVDAYPTKFKPVIVEMKWATLDTMAGQMVNKQESVSCLKRLGFKVTTNVNGLKAQVPFWRRGDVDNGIDLTEEILRLNGYSTLKTSTPTGATPVVAQDVTFQRESQIKQILADLGWSEVMTYSFISESLVKDSGFAPDKCLRVANPLSGEYEYMRPSLLPGMMSVVAQNLGLRDEVRAFELSRAYFPNVKDLPEERPYLVLSLAGNKSAEALFFELKGLVSALLERTLRHKASEVVYKKLADSKQWNASMSAEVWLGKTKLGVLGAPSQSLLNNFGLKVLAILLELDLEVFLQLMNSDVIFEPLPKYPTVRRDLAILIDGKATYDEVCLAIKSSDRLVESCELFDVFKDKKTSGKQSWAFHISYRDKAKTLQTEEVDKVQDKIIKLLADKFGAIIRK